jgi:hypothetical protein
MGDMAATKRKRPEQPPEPARPTIADVDSWLTQIDQVLEEAPAAERKAP